jgi:integrase
MLTRAKIEGAKAKKTGAYEIWDDELGGFGCRIYPSGQRSFIVFYRKRGSRKLIRQTIGRYGKVTVAQARETAKEWLARRELGQDPMAPINERRKAEEAAKFTVKKLAEQYLAALPTRAANSKQARGRDLTPDYIRDVKRNIGRLVDALGRERADTITRANIELLLDRYAKSPDTLRKLHGRIYRMFAWAQQRELVERNPAQGIDPPRSKVRTRVLSLNELARIWHATEQLNPTYRDITRLLITTGQRYSEVGGMRWGELDLDRALWSLPAKRTKSNRDHTVPLIPLALAILKPLRAAYRHSQPAPGDLVRPAMGRDSKGPVPYTGSGSGMRMRAMINRTIRLSGEPAIENWVFHDFRRSVVSLCADAGVDITVLDMLLNHAAAETRGGVLGVYQHSNLLGPMRQAMTVWNALLSTAINPPAGNNRANVVKLRA